MKKFILLFFIGTLSLNLMAQKSGKDEGLFESCFSVSTGVGLPVGSFGSSSKTDPNAYNAKPGLNIELGYTARFSKYFGINIMARAISMAHAVTNTGDYFNGDDPKYYWSAESTPNKIKTVLAGLYTCLPLGEEKKLAVYFKPMIGASFIAQSVIDYKLYDKETKVQHGDVQVTPSGQSYSFTYAFALGLRYDITPLFAFTAQADYMSTKPLFNAQSVSDLGLYIQYRDVTPYTVHMQTMNYTIGLAVKLN